MNHMSDIEPLETPARQETNKTNLPTINDSLKFIYVGLNQFGCTRSDNQNPVIKTKALGPCIGLVIRDPETTTTAVAHIAGLTGGVHKINETMRDVVQCLDGMSRSGLQLKFSERKRLQIAVLGGFDDSDGRLSALKNALDQLNLSEPYLDIRSKMETSPLSFAVDSRTGQISYLENLVIDQKTEDLTMEMMSNQFKDAEGIRITSDARTLG
jgi:hypothetical protein